MKIIIQYIYKNFKCASVNSKWNRPYAEALDDFERCNCDNTKFAQTNLSERQTFLEKWLDPPLCRYFGIDLFNMSTETSIDTQFNLSEQFHECTAEDSCQENEHGMFTNNTWAWTNWLRWFWHSLFMSTVKVSSNICLVLVSHHASFANYYNLRVLCANY